MNEGLKTKRRRIFLFAPFFLFCFVIAEHCRREEESEGETGRERVFSSLDQDGRLFIAMENKEFGSLSTEQLEVCNV